jgi:hypothetical protein
MWLGRGEKECIQYFSGKMCWRMMTWMTRKKCEDDITMGLREVGYKYMRLMELVQDRVQ